MSGNDPQDDELLYEEYLTLQETNNETTSTSRTATPMPPPSPSPQEIRNTISTIIHSLEHEIPPTRGNGPNERGLPIFANRRTNYLRSLVRNLLLLDYFIMILLFPFSIYNIIRSGFNSMTLSHNNDFINEIYTYFVYFNSLNFDLQNKFGLLGKFHNIVLYNFMNIIRFVENSNLLDTKWKNVSIRIIHFGLIKSLTTIIYCIYGFGGTIYLIVSGFFFVLCFTIAINRRYKEVSKIFKQNFVTDN
ncbi:hypothetical protein KAFR_0A07280 [Kazachstania africana CBS 2517]|uniref:Uncharacterized protein n=1 Tax=Kazachstania africana (strain ATCC 22294 / BCRC 22015 / CBS 2517 / CECT 1963 / NBRC 1671 / NRRL Y-8276) TaxID=1071382 RepID=H2AP62_KAZAF|nr:hypothetical protein KAFR_0A07280 [Kazachstania africana CBS 2517]CCF56162.1 hypothetical protein KAFR_0A07280 [Kazachstania africana CBS 2517]